MDKKSPVKGVGPVPDYIQKRIRQEQPQWLPVVPGSAPVVGFGNIRQATVATLSWNPSKLEFLGRKDLVLSEENRRLETLDSLGVEEITSAPDEIVERVYEGCLNYFSRHPYWWFN